MGIVRLTATGIAVLVAAMLVQAGSSASAAPTWESRQVAVGSRERGDSLFGVSCPAASFCVAVGSRGAIVTSDNPSGGAGAWRSETAQPGPYVGTSPGEDRTSPGTFESVSCPTAGMCAAVTQAGDLYVSAGPAGGADTWRATDLDGQSDDTHLKGVSCPTVTFCVAVAAGSGAVGSGGAEIIGIGSPLSASPSSDRAQLDGSLELQAVACPSLAFCIAVANKGRIVASSNPTGPTPLWREMGAPGGPGDLAAVDCPEASFCLAGNARGNVLSNVDASAAGGWREANSGPSVPITGISCPTISRCLAVDNNGDVAVSTNPTGRSGSWSATNLIPFAPSGSQGQPFNAFFGASCPSAGFCAAVGSRGMIFTSANPFDVEQARRGKRRRGPRRPRMKIVRSDRFARQSHTRGAGTRVTFRLRPYGRARGFVCRLDRRRFHRCKSPLRIYARVGTHVLRARAIGITGLKGPVAKQRFTIRGSRGSARS